MTLVHPESRFTTVSWSLRRDDNNGYVLETYRCGDSTKHHEFGPMPPHIVRSFAQARRRLVAMKMDDDGNPFVLVH